MSVEVRVGESVRVEEVAFEADAPDYGSSPRTRLPRRHWANPASRRAIMMRIQLVSIVDIYNSWQELPPNTVGMVKTLS